MKLGPKATEQVVSSLLKRKLEESNEEKSTSVSLCQIRGGQPMNITVGANNNKNTPKQQLLSVDDFLKIQNRFHLSQKKTIGIAQALRVATSNSKLVEPHLKQKLSEKIHCVDKYFSVKNFNFVNLKNSQIISTSSEAVAICTDLKGLINHVKEKREVSDVHLKFGIDGGGGFLKISLSVQSTNENHERTGCRQTYDQGILAKRFKDSGVNKLFIIALTQCSENYNNVSLLWSELNINDFLGTIATDLKLANIISGIMSHSSSFPCTWCYAKKMNLKKKRFIEL